MNFYYAAVLGLSALVITGCQSINTPIKTSVETPKASVSNKTQDPSSKVKVTPYPDSGIISQSQTLPTPPAATPPRIILPEQSATSPRNIKDGHGVSAYHHLMQDYLQSLRSNDLSSAENTLIQAQRIAPQSADVYRELARLSNIKKQGASAESFARKGLTFARNNTQRKQLWQQILHSAQIRHNDALVEQAQQQLGKY